MSRLTFACAAIAAAFLSTSVSARDYDVGPLRISHAWIRPTPPGAPTAAGYLTVANHGAAPDHLLGGTSSDLARIEIHQMSMTGAIMRMRPVVGGLAIAPGKTVQLTAGGDYHLMLIGPKHALKAGDQIPATLRFEKAGEVKVVFVVENPAAKAASSMPGMDMH